MGIFASLSQKSASGLLGCFDNVGWAMGKGIQPVKKLDVGLLVVMI